MFDLLASLRESDIAVLGTIARFWGVDTGRMEPAEIATALDEVMCDADNAAAAWEKLDDNQRGVLQTLIGSRNQMPAVMFERLNGAIRKMGRGQIEREDPLGNPESVSESLFYRGLIYSTFEQASTGARQIIYVPEDLAAVLPSHQTTYDNLEAEIPTEGGLESVEPLDADLLEDVAPADTTIVDDMATLLAYFQVNGGEIQDDALVEDDKLAIRDHLLNADDNRLTFLFEVGIGAALYDVDEGRIHNRRAEVKRWLESSRAQQLKWLVDAWRKTGAYRDLWHVPGLYPDESGWPYDPVAARTALLDLLKNHSPQGEWWSIDEFITVVKNIEPDFQRPGGDYNSWYIRNADGEYLNGFESWDAVEGALLEFYFMGPMHWLGMVDLGEDAARLNAYGRSLVNETDWPQPPADTDPIEVQPDGTLLISRRVTRFERFQAMRFTTWVSPATDESSYIYKISMEGVRLGAEQGINTGHIAAFLQRHLGSDDLPPTLKRQLETWQAGPSSSATLETLLVLRTTAPETLDYIMNTPELRRFCRSRLGSMAVAVLPESWEDLKSALEERGIQLERLS